MSNLSAESLATLRPDPRDASDSFQPALLSAYVHAEHVRTFNRLLLRRLVAMAFVWLVAGRFVLLLGWPVLLVCCAMPIGGGLWGMVAERRATSRLRSLLRR